MSSSGRRGFPPPHPGLFDYTLGTRSLLPGVEPDPDHPGQVKPFWGAAEALDISTEVITPEATRLNLTAFLVRPQLASPTVWWTGTGRPKTTGGMVEQLPHLLRPRASGAGRPGHELQRLHRFTPTPPRESTNGVIDGLDMNPGVVGNGDPPAPDATGYLGLELTQRGIGGG